MESCSRKRKGTRKISSLETCSEYVGEHFASHRQTIMAFIWHTTLTEVAGGGGICGWSSWSENVGWKRKHRTIIGPGTSDALLCVLLWDGPETFSRNWEAAGEICMEGRLGGLSGGDIRYGRKMGSLTSGRYGRRHNTWEEGREYPMERLEGWGSILGQELGGGAIYT